MNNFPIAIRGMTAYGEAISDPFFFQIIIQSVNRRFLEISLNTPKSLASFEPEVRKWVSTVISRGQVNISIIINPDQQKQHIIPNLSLAREIKKAWNLLAHELELKEEFPISLLTQEKNLFFQEGFQGEIDILLLEKTMKSALEKHKNMREIEGNFLLSDIQIRLILIKQFLQNIEAAKEESYLSNLHKMKKRAKEIFEKEFEERVLKEMAFFGEKIDITEEIVRFQSLFKEFEETLTKPLNSLDTKGKKLDFLLQELSREVNTISAKSLSADIAKNVVNIKSELEKIKEQVQNIE